MSSTPSGGSRRPIWSSLGATGAAVLLAILVALPAVAESHGSGLVDASVSPRAGTTVTSFAFWVAYRGDQRGPSANVFVLIDGVAHPMVHPAADVSGRRWRFTLSTRLRAGTHQIGFRVQIGNGQTEEIAGGTVTVSVASVPGKPTPKPKPKAPRPAPRPTPESTPKAAPAPAVHSSGGAGGTPAVEAHGRRTSSAAAAQGSGSGGKRLERHRQLRGRRRRRRLSAPGPRRSAGADRRQGSGHSPGQVAGGTSVPPSGASGGNDPAHGWGDPSLFLQALGLGGSGPTTAGLLPSLVGSAGAMTLVMAFMFFGKRRRDGEPPEPDEVLQAAAARGAGRAPGGELVPDRVAVAPGFMDAEASMPRWRRPSLLEARKTDPLRTMGVAAPLSFEHGSVGPLDGHERRLVRYSVVSLLDTPDELHAREIGHISRGDEVQLLERSGSYWQVLCPDGRQGWIHKMTLGEVVGEPAAPNARDTWATSSIQIDDVDSDVLTAFMAARGRA